MSSEQPYIPFSQRTGLKPVPPQFGLGIVSADLRRLLDYYTGLEMERSSVAGATRRYFEEGWKRVSMDLHVIFHELDPATYNESYTDWKAALHKFIQKAAIGRLFDLVEFLIRHPRCGNEFKGDIASAFVTARSAYRIVDDQIVAIGTEEQAAAFERALADTDNAVAARKHLTVAGAALRNSDWAGCVRESIHAVEAVALRLAPDTATLGPALAALEKHGHLHGGLRAAFSALYGYSSDEEGVRHSLVFKDEAQVDETDALFMLGACASFVSYLIARARTRT